MDDNGHHHLHMPPTALLIRSRRFSLIWIIPIAAAIAGAWLGWRSYMEHGPTITIDFATASGLEAGRTRIKYKDADMGLVETIKPADDLSHFTVTARMRKVAEPYLTKDARFWVSTPSLYTRDISGLGTLIAGAYIEFVPGKGEAARNFIGEQSPNVVPPESSGTVYTLHATQLGSIHQGTPAYFRGVKVGEVLGYELSDKDGSAVVLLFVQSPHDQLVHIGTRFWNTSGISILASSSGVKMQLESIQSLLAGGITFGTPSNVDAGAVAGGGTQFTLYADANSAQDATYTKRAHFLLRFTDPVPGIVTGSPVRMQGLPVGQVNDVHIDYDSESGSMEVLATIEVEAERIKVHQGDDDSKTFEGDAKELFRKLVARGMRASVGNGNLLTGQKAIDLNFVPEAQPATLVDNDDTPEIPVTDGNDIDSVIRSAKHVLNNLEVTTTAVNAMVKSPEMAQSLKSLHHTIASLDKITSDASVRTGPLLQSLQEASKSANAILGKVDKAIASGNGGGDLAGTMREIKDAARSLRVLTDYLEAHPEAVLKGKPKDAKP